MTDDTASTELERDDAIAGRVFTNGVAQQVTRENGVTRVALTCMSGNVPARDGLVTIPFAVPVTVEAGESVAVSVEWLDGSVDESMPPVRMSSAATFTKAVKMLGGGGAAFPGSTEGATGGPGHGVSRR